MGTSRTAAARRAYEHLQRLLMATQDNAGRQRLREKVAGAKRRLEILERNHVKREEKAVVQGIGGEWWREINRPRERESK